MKKIAAILLSGFVSAGSFAQGFVIFANNPSTLVSASQSHVPYDWIVTPITGPAGSWYFALLTSPSGDPGTFSFTGLYATNVVNSTGGRFRGGTVQVPNWAAGARMSYEVASWQASLGPTFNPAWLFNYPSGGLFGISSVGSGVAGGQIIPPLPLFGGNGITQGWAMAYIPEPGSMALVGLGTAILCLSRRLGIKGAARITQGGRGLPRSNRMKAGTSAAWWLQFPIVPVFLTHFLSPSF